MGVAQSQDASFGLEESRNLNRVEPVVHILRRRQVPHGGFERLVSHPVLHGADIKTGAQHPRGVGGAEGLEVEFLFVQTGAERHRFALVEQMIFAIAGRRGEHEPPAVLPRMFCMLPII